MTPSPSHRLSPKNGNWRPNLARIVFTLRNPSASFAPYTLNVLTIMSSSTTDAVSHPHTDLATVTAQPVTTKRILVSLATGKQGSGVVRALAADNAKTSPTPTEHRWTILAVTRNANSAKAKQIGSLPGVQLVEGSLSNPDALFDESKTGGPVYGVFSAQQGADNPDGGVKGEIIQGKALADAAVKAGVQHFIYSGTDFGGVASTNVPQLVNVNDLI